MAQKMLVQLVDDLDGTAINDGKGETVSFALDGAGYEIDLSDKNAAKLRDSLSRYVAAARKVSGGRGRRSGRRGQARTDRDQLQAIREWARGNGHRVSDRGRISATVMDAYNAAH
jgi:hypothetical protein